MKKIVFVINNMKIGGTRTSLLNLISLNEFRDCEISLLLLADIGP